MLISQLLANAGFYTSRILVQKSIQVSLTFSIYSQY
jgi:hypothetical protein